VAKKKSKKVGIDEISDGNKEILFDILSDNDVEFVTVSFDGSGDDGQLEGNDLPANIKNIVVEGAKISQGSVWSSAGTEKKYKSNPTVDEIVDSLCYEVLESLYGGWENNDGAFGQFLFSVKDRSVRLEYNARYTDSELFEHDF
jgi:hypothetical protein